MDFILHNPIVKTQKPSANSWYHFEKSVYVHVHVTKCNVVNFDNF